MGVGCLGGFIAAQVDFGQQGIPSGNWEIAVWRWQQWKDKTRQVLSEQDKVRPCPRVCLPGKAQLLTGACLPLPIPCQPKVAHHPTRRQRGPHSVAFAISQSEVALLP